jgi:hypothetical protein
MGSFPAFWEGLRFGANKNKKGGATMPDYNNERFNSKALAREVRGLIDNAEHPVVMQMFLFQAIGEFAAEFAKADPDAITKEKGIPGHQWIACARQVLLKREAEAAINDDFL